MIPIAKIQLIIEKMFIKTKIFTIFLIFSFSLSNSFATDIPIIVIAPSKKAQSISTVGSTTTVYNENDIKNSNNFFLGDVLGTNTTSYNFSKVADTEHNLLFN